MQHCNQRPSHGQQVRFVDGYLCFVVASGEVGLGRPALQSTAACGSTEATWMRAFGRQRQQAAAASLVCQLAMQEGCGTTMHLERVDRPELGGMLGW